jgi:hypothetical protein
MSEVEKGQVMTANRLRDGEVVFLTRAGVWSEKIDDAVLALEPQAKAALETRAKLTTSEKAHTSPGLPL